MSFSRSVTGGRYAARDRATLALPIDRWPLRGPDRAPWLSLSIGHRYAVYPGHRSALYPTHRHVCDWHRCIGLYAYVE